MSKKGKTTVRLLAAALALAFVLASAGCGAGKAEVGAKLAHNVARLYKPESRESVFLLDGRAIEGSVKGTAYMDASAKGESALAWVDTVLYFVSEKGIDQLGTGIGTAEISFDGNIALFLLGNELKLYSLDTRSVTTVDSGIVSITQFAISPNSESIAFTAVYEGEGADSRAKLYKGGELTAIFDDGSSVPIAISDDAKLMYCLDQMASTFYVLKDGERTDISDACGADANYNFTIDLSEVAFNTADGTNHIFRLSDKLDKELGEGFDFTLKTDVYSISTVTFFTYINDTASFMNGLWQKRTRTEESYLYSVGLLDGKGEISWLAQNADEVAPAPDGSRLIWLSGTQLYSTNMKGENKLLAGEAEHFVLTEDGENVYYTVRGTLYCVKGTGSPVRIDGGVSDIMTIGSVCVYIRESDGKLMCAENGKTEEIMDNAYSLDGRAGQLIAYCEPAAWEDSTVCKAYATVDGRSYELIAEGARP